MKSLNLLINLVGREKSYEQTRKGRYTLESIVSRLCLVSLICLCMLTVGVEQMWGAYTITFATADNSNPTSNYTTSTACSSIVSAGASFLSGNVASATNAYGPGTYGLKLGQSGSNGTIRVNLASSVTPSSIVVTCRRYNAGTAATLQLNGETAQRVTADECNITFHITSSTTYLEFTASKYIWISSVTVNTNTESTLVDIIKPKGFAGYTTGSYCAAGTDKTATANNTNATSVSYKLQVYNGSTGAIKGNSSGSSNFSARNATTKSGYFISKVELSVTGGTINGANCITNNRSLVYFGTSAFDNPATEAPTGYPTGAMPASSGQSTLTWYNGVEDISYFILYDIQTANTASAATLTITWTAKSSCTNSVTINEGTETNCTFTLGTTGSQESCNGVSTTVTVNPNTGYGNPTVTQSGASADPTISGSGNNWTVSYGNNTTGTSTINVSCSANNYTVTLNDNGGSGGSGSKTVTYNANTNLTTNVAVPTRGALYDFAGYWTSTDGGSTFGTQLVNADGSWKASVTNYTDGSKNWIKADNVTLYAKWTEKALTNYRTTCGLDINVEGNVWLTSYNNVQVYTTEESANLITITCTDFGTANRLGVQYLLNGSPVTKTSSPFRLHFYGLAGKTNYNLADGGGSAGGYDYFALSDADKTAIASGQTFAISYKPKPGSGDDVYDQEHTYTLRIAALDGSTDLGHKDLTLHGRALPEQFVIASKVGDQWYALPNTILDNDRAIEPIKITVDNTTTPTRATNVPNTTAYQGKGRYESGTNRYGIRLTDPSGHWLQVSSSSGTNYVWVSGTGSSTCQDWNLSSTDFGAYTLTVPSSGAGDKKMGIKSGNMGYYASPDDPSQQIYLLPADFYTEAEAQILKWKANSVIVMYTGTETSSTTKVGSNSASSAQTLSSQKLTHGIYELTTGQALTSNAGQTLALTFGSTKKEYDIPLIISGSTTASANGGDVVILSGGTFTAAATNYSFRNVYVYGGGKLAIPSGTSLGTSDIILRAGGISTNGSGGSATYEYVYPQFSLIGTLTNSSGKFRYEYVTDYSHWYHLCLPFDATLSTITYPQEYYGNNVTASNKGSWVIKRYDGATRADGDYDAWVDIESESATEVTAGHGYIYWGAPKKVTISGDKQRQAWGIQRMTMTKAASTATTAEANNKTVTGLEAYSGTGQVNDQGWNLVGNPYMVNLSGLSSTSLQTGKLVHEEVGGQWTGRWESNGDGMRYITQPSEHFDTYEAVKVTSATVTLTAGKAFFVQLAGDATALQFEASKRVNMPSLYRQNSVDVETGIVMSNSTYNDKVEFWIKDGKTAEYEVNADYPKTMNGTNFNIYGVHSHGNLSWVAIGPEIAEGSMPIGYQVPGEGDYTLSLLEPAASELESLLVTDHGVEPNVTVDLVEQDYVFHVNQAETNDARFTVSIELKDETPEDPENPGTGVDENKDIERPIKFIYQDKLYILRNGVIYDATGRRVSEINK